jgi:hypothetical protein
VLTHPANLRFGGFYQNYYGTTIMITTTVSKATAAKVVSAYRFGLSVLEAKEILTDNFFGIEAWTSLYDWPLTETEQRLLPIFPWGRDILLSPCPFFRGKRVYQTHFAFWGRECVGADPLNILKWHVLEPNLFWFKPDAHYKEQAYTQKPLRSRWYLLPPTIVPGSMSKDWPAQRQFLETYYPEYEIPKAVVEITKLVLLYKISRTRYNSDYWARTWGLGSFSAQTVCVGKFQQDGLDVGDFYEAAKSDIGLSASRKLPAWYKDLVAQILPSLVAEPKRTYA